MPSQKTNFLNASYRPRLVLVVRVLSHLLYKSSRLRSARTAILLFLLAPLIGCNAFPDIRHKPKYHNPFPQIQTVAVLPFRNQSQDPSLSGNRVTLAYYNELQMIPGFEVLPTGLVETQLSAFEQQELQRPVASTEDLQKFAEYLGVDAVLHGSITDYDSYYPPRMTLKVNWYAANPGFHPIPPGYGLPWGTKDEKKIPEWIRLESERALAREQIATQSPIVTDPNEPPAVESEPLPPGIETDHKEASNTNRKPNKSLQASNAVTESKENRKQRSLIVKANQEEVEGEPIRIDSGIAEESAPARLETAAITNSSTPFSASPLPTVWPDPQGFIPPSPQSIRPRSTAQSEPIITHMRAYNGNDEEFTEKLSDYYYFRDDARFGGWEAYLQRSEDFIRFCCYTHIVETLASRGGQLKSQTVVRWPINRYER